MTAKTPAPSDEAANAAWDRIMRDARAHGLVVQAAGGVATLACPEEQRESGCRERVLQMHDMTEPRQAIQEPGR